MREITHLLLPGVKTDLQRSRVPFQAAICVIWRSASLWGILWSASGSNFIGDIRRYSGLPELSIRGDTCHFLSTNAKIVVRSSRYSRSNEALHPSPNARHAATKTLNACCRGFREQAGAEVAGRLLPDLGELDYSEAGSFEAFGIIPLFPWLSCTIAEQRRPRSWPR